MTPNHTPKRRAAARLLTALAVLALCPASSQAEGSFTLKVDSPGAVNGALLAIAQTNSVVLYGTNTLSGSTRVVVEGSEAAFEPATGLWSLPISLKPGFNRFLVQAMDAAGAQLLATNQDIVGEFSSLAVGGTLEPQAILTSSMGIFRVTNSLIVPPGGSLVIEPGCVFLLAPGANILVTNATITARGTMDAPIYFAPANGSTAWGGFLATGGASHLHAQHLELVAGHIDLTDGGVAILEDCYLHDYTTGVPPVIRTLGRPNPCQLTMRRCHLSRYYEMLCQLSLVRIEDCLMEYLSPGGDGIDFDGGQAGSFIRRCTVRHGRFTNIDAIDMGEFGGTGEPSRGILIDECLLYDFVDKGISMGVQVDVTATNCLIYQTDSAIAVKDLSTAGIYGCTIVSNNYGFNCYNKADLSSASGGGLITNSFNNILWHNRQAVSLRNGSALTASYSSFQGTNFPGPGNVSLDPAWLDPDALDFRLGAASPLLHAGADGSSMGATFPVGATMAPSHPRINSIERSDAGITLEFWADSERSYSLLASDTPSGGAWANLANLFPRPLPQKVSIADSPPPATARFYKLITPRLSR